MMPPYTSVPNVIARSTRFPITLGRPKRPVRASTDLATLQANKTGLDAAQALAERAEKLLEWPIDDRMVAWMTVVVTGVATSLVVRFVLEAVGI